MDENAGTGTAGTDGGADASRGAGANAPPPPRPAAPVRGRRGGRGRVVLVTVFTVDLGPNLRELAEREGTKYMERPMHIGRLSAKLTPGEFVVEDLLIEGLTPTDRPFLKAKKIDVRAAVVDGRSAASSIVESVTMTDWDMVVEPGPAAGTAFRRSRRRTRARARARSRRRCRSVLATRGQFTYDDHGDAVEHRRPQPDASSSIAASRPTTIAAAPRFTNGTVKIQSYQPFRMDMQSRFSSTAARCTSTAWTSSATARGRSRPATSTSAAGPSSSISSSRGSTFRPRRTSSFTGRSSTSRASATSPGRFISSRADAS